MSRYQGYRQWKICPDYKHWSKLINILISWHLDWQEASSQDVNLENETKHQIFKTFSNIFIHTGDLIVFGTTRQEMQRSSYSIVKPPLPRCKFLYDISYSWSKGWLKLNKIGYKILHIFSYHRTATGLIIWDVIVFINIVWSWQFMIYSCHCGSQKPLWTPHTPLVIKYSTVVFVSLKYCSLYYQISVDWGSLLLSCLTTSFVRKLPTHPFYLLPQILTQFIHRKRPYERLLCSDYYAIPMDSPLCRPMAYLTALVIWGL